MQRVVAALPSACVAAAFGLAACRAHLSPPRPDEFRGLYETGFESGGFRACDPTVDDGLWRRVRFADSSVAPARWPAGTPTGMSAVLYYVRWRGALAPAVPGGTGRARELLVTEVLEVRAARIKDCGWDGR